MPSGSGQQQRFHQRWMENKGGHMSASVLYMSMSLDGYIAGPNDGPDTPGGGGLRRLHEWGFNPGEESLRSSGPGGQMMDELMVTGAVLVGRRTAEHAGDYGGGGDSVVRLFCVWCCHAP